MVFVWALLVGGAYFVMRRRVRGAVVVGLAVVSHWVLDLIVHHPDLPLRPGGTTFLGMGLWGSLPGSLALESLLFGLGLWCFLHATEAVDRIGSLGFWALIAFLVLIHLANVFGPPPPSVAAVAWVGHAQWLIVLWAYWVDAHRRPSRRVR
jgi:hypothetical protein